VSDHSEKWDSVDKWTEVERRWAEVEAVWYCLIHVICAAICFLYEYQDMSSTISQDVNLTKFSHRPDMISNAK
jgi:hypothetical protein